MKRLALAMILLMPALLLACGGDDDDDGGASVASVASDVTTPAEQQTAQPADGETPGIRSPSLTPDGAMPPHFTCDGEDVSPELSWGDPTPDTQSFLLVMEDLDAPGGVFTHWLMHEIDASVRSLPEGVDKTAEPANGEGGIQIENDFGDIGYGGPCPPPGELHRYRFRLFYLDSPLELEPGATREEVEAAVAGHPIGETSIIVTYQREQ
jgi:Raf kinase inhibitor-like YbhB/YbcL family protein